MRIRGSIRPGGGPSRKPLRGSPTVSGLEAASAEEVAVEPAAVGHQPEEVSGDGKGTDEGCEERGQRSVRPFHSARPWPRGQPPSPSVLGYRVSAKSRQLSHFPKRLSSLLLSIRYEHSKAQDVV